MSITIVIPTLNRSHLYDRILSPLLLNLENIDKVVIVDNGSGQEHIAAIKYKISAYSKIDLIQEPNSGTSYARNRGILENQSEWILFIDDDVILPNNFVEIIENSISYTPCYDSYGGCYYPVFTGDIPSWMPLDYGCNCTSTSIGFLSKKDDFVGGCILIKSEVIKKIGGFDTNLGPRDNRFSYGEDTQFAEKLIKNNFSVAINPNLKVGHIIEDYKTKLWWNLNSFYKKGLASIEIAVDNEMSLSIAISRLLKKIIKLMLKIVKRILTFNFKSITKDIFVEGRWICYYFGQFIARLYS